MVLQILFQVANAENIFLHLLPLGIGDEDDAINVPQYKLPGGVVNHLPGNRVQLELHFEAVQSDCVDREKIKKKCSIGLCRKGDQIAAAGRRNSRMDVQQIACFASERRPVIDNLELNLSAAGVDNWHG